MPGVGQYTVAVIVAEVGEINRFDEDKELVSYAGLDPTVHQSGHKEIRGGISKEGSAPLHWALVQCANITVRCDEPLGNFYTRLKERKNHQIAIVAAARKMLVSIFHVLTRKEAYDPPEVSVRATGPVAQARLAFVPTATATAIRFLLPVKNSGPPSSCCLVILRLRSGSLKLTQTIIFSSVELVSTGFS
uniref:transposase n=1 Tax=Haloarcula japonica TaxID=29282 RepID=UPI00373FCB85